MTMDWKEWEVIYNNDWTARFRHIVNKRLPRSADIAEATMEEVRQELAIKLTSVATVPESVNAYLKTAFRNTLEDYLRLKHGYPRPPALIKRLGSAYVRIYKLLCLEQRSFNDIHAIVESLYQYKREYVDQLVREVRAVVVDCGSWRESVSLDMNQTEIDSKTAGMVENIPEDILHKMDMEAIINTILGNKHTGRRYSDAIKDVLQALQHCISNDDERLLLRLIYTDGHSVSHAARILKLPDVKARKLLKNVVQRLRQVIENV